MDFMVRNPQEQLKEQESETVAATSKEISKASSVDKILDLVDNQKAAAIKDYVRTKFGRQSVRTDSEDQNCFFQSVLMQLGKKESMQDQKGILYSPQNLRLQAIDYVDLNYSDMFPVLGKHLTTSLKTWCTKMLSDQEPADFPICVAVRYLINIILLIFQDGLCKNRVDYTILNPCKMFWGGLQDCRVD